MNRRLKARYPAILHDRRLCAGPAQAKSRNQPDRDAVPAVASKWRSLTILCLFIAIGNRGAGVPAPQQPTLPMATINLALPTQGATACPRVTTGSSCIRHIAAGDAASFQKALNAATCGDTIELVAGSTYVGNFTVPATACLGWVLIMSSGLSNLPPPRTRVSPSSASQMARVMTPNTGAAIRFLPKSNHWRLIGLEITTSYNSAVNSVYRLVSAGESADGSIGVSVPSELPDHIIFDRIYIHGLSTTNSNHGIVMDGSFIAVVDSYCDEIHNNGFDSQCFASSNGPGPFLIQNNFMQAGAVDVIFGGADPAIAGLISSDITIVGNLIQKNPAWRAQPAPYNWDIKNLVEFKNAQRVLLDGNVIQYVWAANQPGFAILLTPRNSNGKCSWCVVQDITITHNLIRHASSGIEISGGDAFAGPSLPTGRVLIQNNVLDDISSVRWGGDGRAFMILSNANSPNPHDIAIDHNTAFSNVVAIMLGDSGRVGIMRLSNNLWDYGAYGVIGNSAGIGVPSLSTYIASYSWEKNLFINRNGLADGSLWPRGTFWSTQTNAHFTNFSAARYQLLSTSPYHNAGTDGKDIGVWNWTCLNSDSANALAGKFAPQAGCALNVKPL